jgi:hypothetical protein
MIDVPLPHEAPEGYFYEVKTFKRNVVSIWLCSNTRSYFTDRIRLPTIWGFYNTRKRQYYSPLTSTKQGDPVEIDRTTPYSAMVPKLNPLEMALYV